MLRVDGPRPSLDKRGIFLDCTGSCGRVRKETTVLDLHCVGLVSPAVDFSNEPEYGQAEQDEGGAEEGATDVAGVAPDENGRSADDEDSGKQRISPDAIGASELGVTAAIVRRRW